MDFYSVKVQHAEGENEEDVWTPGFNWWTPGLG